MAIWTMVTVVVCPSDCLRFLSTRSRTDASPQVYRADQDSIDGPPDRHQRRSGRVAEEGL